MQYTKAELKKRNSPSKSVEVAMEQPEYPYGLEITVNDKGLKALGIDVKDCNVKDKVTVVAECFIKNLSSRSSVHDSSEDRMELQIEKMAIDKGMKKKGVSYTDYDKMAKGGPG